MNGYWKAYVEANGKTLDEARDIFIKLADESVNVLWYYHPFGKKGKGPHFHALVQDGTRTDETYRDRLKEAFGVSGAGTFGVSNTYKRGTKMSELTVEEYVKYMTKGEYEPFFNKGFDKEWIQKCKDMWKPENKNILGDVVVNIMGSGRANRITQVSIAKMALEKYFADVNSDNAKEFFDEDEFCANARIKKKKITNIVLDLLKEYNMSRNYRQVANIVQDCWYEVEPKAYLAKIYSMV